MQTVVFRKEKEHYKRDTAVLTAYVDQASLYLSKVKNISLQEARNFVTTNMRKGGKFEFVDPVVKMTYRENFEDRELVETTMSQFMSDAVQNNESISPTFTTYCSPRVKQSLLALFTHDNIGLRDIIKNEMFDAERAGDTVLYVFKNLGQNGAKTTNNALSGASLSPSTAIFNPTSHSSLTTNCQNTTAYGNANNEKFIEGNRHYFSIDIILNNLISITAISNYDEIEIAMKRFQLYYPTQEDVLDVIMRSKDLYFRSNTNMGPIYEFVKTMRPLERAAFVYTGDFYHLWKHNEVFVLKFLKEMIYLPTNSIELEQADVMIKTFSEEVINLARQICRQFSAGKKPKEIRKESEYNYGILASCANNINTVLCEIQDFINAFWMSPNMPASTGNFRYSVRRSVLGGDTDSTLFTAQEWVQRVYGTIGFTNEMDSTSDVMIFLAALTSSHLHAQMSANYGVDIDRIFDIQMKNEYKFGLFIPTSMAKHYWAMRTAQEGNVKTKPELELKGANLISSATPGTIVKEVKELLMVQMKKIYAGEGLHLNDLIDTVADKENMIYQDVKAGNTDYFRILHLKPSKAYKNTDPDRNPYWNYLFWNRTFGKIYGMVDEPPYSGLKVSLEISNVSEYQLWTDQITNKALVEDIDKEIARIGRKFITNVIVPITIVQTGGIPDEILLGSNARKIVRDCCGAYYHILESMGIFMANKKNTRMIYDLY